MQQSVRGFIAALLLTLAVSDSARADMGFPGMRSARPTLRITTRDTFPDHVFVICGPKNSAFGEFVKLAPDIPIIHKTDGSVYLLIIPQAVAGPFQTARELADAVESGCVKATLSYLFPYKEDVPKWYGSELTIDYRVQRTASGGIEIVRTTWDQGYQCCVVAIALPVTTLFGSVWLIRRRRRRKVIPPG